MQDLIAFATTTVGGTLVNGMARRENVDSKFWSEGCNLGGDPENGIDNSGAIEDSKHFVTAIWYTLGEADDWTTDALVSSGLLVEPISIRRTGKARSDAEYSLLSSEGCTAPLTNFGESNRSLVRFLGVLILGESRECESLDARKGVNGDDSGRSKKSKPWKASA